MKDTKVIGLMGSLRGCKVPLDTLYSVLDTNNIADEIYRIGSEKRLSNSEALLLAALWGAKQENIEVEFVRSGAITPDFSGIVISSPVYFGDRSSLVDDFIREQDTFRNKAVGVVSSGAKRNGGQETTNVYALYDCLGKGAIITGNGPPTGQYGGTGWAGNKGAIIDDDFGIKTSIGTGRRVARLAKIITRPDYTNQVKVLFIVTNVVDSKLERRFVNSIRELPFSTNVELDILDISKRNIRRCRACPICPNGDIDEVYTCIVRDDDMKDIHSHIIDSDCIVLASCISSSETSSKFQIFMERSRFVRRHHYELADRVYSSYSWSDSLVDVFPLRTMTSFLRQNMFALGPFYRKFDSHESVSKESYVNNLEKFTQKTKQARIHNSVDAEYTPVGYEDAGRDKEQAYRD